MVGRDNPKVVTKAGIRDLLSGIVPDIGTDELTVNDSFTDPGGETYNGVVDSLKDAGYNDGDILPVTGISTQSRRSSSTTSTTFVTETTLHDSLSHWGRLVPVTNAFVALSVRFNSDTGETPTGRIYNSTDDEEVLSVTGNAGAITDIFTPWQGYQPPTTGDPIQLIYQHKTDTGTNSIASVIPTLWFGVEL